MMAVFLCVCLRLNIEQVNISIFLTLRKVLNVKHSTIVPFNMLFK